MENAFRGFYFLVPGNWILRRKATKWIVKTSYQIIQKRHPFLWIFIIKYWSGIGDSQNSDPFRRILLNPYLPVLIPWV